MLPHFAGDPCWGYWGLYSISIVWLAVASKACRKQGGNSGYHWIPSLQLRLCSPPGQHWGHMSPLHPLPSKLDGMLSAISVKWGLLLGIIFLHLSPLGRILPSGVPSSRSFVMEVGRDRKPRGQFLPRVILIHRTPTGGEGYKSGHYWWPHAVEREGVFMVWPQRVTCRCSLLRKHIRP